MLRGCLIMISLYSLPKIGIKVFAVKHLGYLRERQESNRGLFRVMEFLYPQTLQNSRL